MSVKNVLVFPAGTEIGQEILNALKGCKEVRLFGAGQDTLNHARFSYSEYHTLPSVHDTGWVERLAALCRKLEIDYVFPAHDDVVLALARATADVPATIISSPVETCEIARSKSATYEKLADMLRVPRLYASAAEIETYPVFVKPDRGEGSRGATKIYSPDDLTQALANVPEPIICEYLPGEEFTVDCFSDRDKGLLFAGARERRRTKNGISTNTITVSLPEIDDLARAISTTLELHGAWFFQLKRAADGEFALLEIAPRIAGSMAVHRVKGVNFPLLSIFEAQRAPITIRTNPGHVELDRALSNRYRNPIDFTALYVDFDDTLILNGKVNIEIVKLIYQCINRSIPVKLLTRHAGNLTRKLEEHRLSGLFDAVIHLRNGELKSQEICEPGAILVDDSFAERMEVSNRRGIPTFDCSMIELISASAECQISPFATDDR